MTHLDMSLVYHRGPHRGKQLQWPEHQVLREDAGEKHRKAQKQEANFLQKVHKIYIYEKICMTDLGKKKIYISIFFLPEA